MRVVVITPPSGVPIDEAVIDQHLRRDAGADDALVQTYVQAAFSHIDGPAGWLGRALGVQTLEARFDGFPWGGPLELPFPPLIDVVSVKYLDANGVEQAADPATYAVLGDMIEPALGFSWPTAREGRETVRVRYRAGYVADPSITPLVQALPAAIRAAILLMAGDMYARRETAASGVFSEVPMVASAAALLNPFRVYR